MYRSSEMLREFKVTSVNNNAEFGQQGDVTVATKGGTNLFHGSGFWYHQNAALDATTYNANVKQAKVYNTFGGSFSGPVLIPKIYNGKDKTFFFVDYEGNRHPGSTLQQFSVPTADMRNGIVTGVPGSPTLDPTTGAPFPNNTIPASRINPVATALLKNYYPLPNENGNTTVANYRRLLPLPSTTDGYDIRGDHLINSKQQIFARWSWKTIPSYAANGILPASNDSLNSKNFIVSHNYSIKPNMINEFRFGFSLWAFNEAFPIVGADAVAPAGTGAFTIFDFSDGTGFTTIGRGRDGPTKSRTYQFTDNFTWIKGRHVMKFGLDIRRLAYEDVLHFGGADDFSNLSFSDSTFSGNAFSDLMLGLPSDSAYAVMGPNLVQNVSHYQFYGQDEWRVNNRLTLSFGLRWQLHPPMTEVSGNITNFNRITGDVIIPDHAVAPAPGFLSGINACPGSTTRIPCTHILTASQAGLPQGLRQTYYGNWTPRFSIAFRPFGDNKTVNRSRPHGVCVHRRARLGHSHLHEFPRQGQASAVHLAASIWRRIRARRGWDGGLHRGG